MNTLGTSLFTNGIEFHPKVSIKQRSFNNSLTSIKPDSTIEIPIDPYADYIDVTSNVYWDNYVTSNEEGLYTPANFINGEWIGTSSEVWLVPIGNWYKDQLFSEIIIIYEALNASVNVINNDTESLNSWNYSINSNEIIKVNNMFNPNGESSYLDIKYLDIWADADVKIKKIYVKPNGVINYGIIYNDYGTSGNWSNVAFTFKFDRDSVKPFTFNFNYGTTVRVEDSVTNELIPNLNLDSFPLYSQDLVIWKGSQTNPFTQIPDALPTTNPLNIIITSNAVLGTHGTYFPATTFQVNNGIMTKL